MANRKINTSNKSVAYTGALLGVAAVFSYSIAIMIYVVIRSSITIYKIMPSGERSDILLINGFSIAYSIGIFSILMALLSSAGGSIAAFILKKTLIVFNPKFNFIRAVYLSFITSLVLLTIVYLLLHPLLKNWMTFNYGETFTFWFLCPAIIFIVVIVVSGSKLNRILDEAAMGLKYKI